MQQFLFDNMIIIMIIILFTFQMLKNYLKQAWANIGRLLHYN
jgi:hypothetical protein